MQIHTHSSSRPWGQGLSSPPARCSGQTEQNRQNLDTYKASSQEKSPVSMLGAGLLALTALTGMVAAQPASAKVVEVQAPTSQEVTPDSLSRDGYRNPDDWKEDLFGGGYRNHCAALPRFGMTQRFNGVLDFQGPDAWKADLGGGNSNSGSTEQSRQRTHNPVQTQRTQRSEYQNPDDWKEEIGGGSYHHDYDYDSGSDSSQSDDWGGPDDWKAGL